MTPPGKATTFDSLASTVEAALGPYILGGSAALASKRVITEAVAISWSKFSLKTSEIEKIVSLEDWPPLKFRTATVEGLRIRIPSALSAFWAAVTGSTNAVLVSVSCESVTLNIELLDPIFWDANSLRRDIRKKRMSDLQAEIKRIFNVKLAVGRFFHSTEGPDLSQGGTSVVRWLESVVRQKTYRVRWPIVFEAIQNYIRGRKEHEDPIDDRRGTFQHVINSLKTASSYSIFKTLAPLVEISVTRFCVTLDLPKSSLTLSLNLQRFDWRESCLSGTISTALIRKFQNYPSEDILTEKGFSDINFELMDRFHETFPGLGVFTETASVVRLVPDAGSEVLRGSIIDKGGSSEAAESLKKFGYFLLPPVGIRCSYKSETQEGREKQSLKILMSPVEICLAGPGLMFIKEFFVLQRRWESFFVNEAGPGIQMVASLNLSDDGFFTRSKSSAKINCPKRNGGELWRVLRRKISLLTSLRKGGSEKNAEDFIRSLETFPALAVSRANLQRGIIELQKEIGFRISAKLPPLYSLLEQPDGLLAQPAKVIRDEEVCQEGPLAKSVSIDALVEINLVARDLGIPFELIRLWIQQILWSPQVDWHANRVLRVPESLKYLSNKNSIRDVVLESVAAGTMNVWDSISIPSSGGLGFGVGKFLSSVRRAISNGDYSDGDEKNRVTEIVEEKEVEDLVEDLQVDATADVSGHNLEATFKFRIPSVRFLLAGESEEIEFGMSGISGNGSILSSIERRAWAYLSPKQSIIGTLSIPYLYIGKARQNAMNLLGLQKSADGLQEFYTLDEKRTQSYIWGLNEALMCRRFVAKGGERTAAQLLIAALAQSYDKLKTIRGTNFDFSQSSSPDSTPRLMSKNPSGLNLNLNLAEQKQKNRVTEIVEEMENEEDRELTEQPGLQICLVDNSIQCYLANHEVHLCPNRIGTAIAVINELQSIWMPKKEMAYGSWGGKICSESIGDSSDTDIVVYKVACGILRAALLNDGPFGEPKSNVPGRLFKEVICPARGDTVAQKVFFINQQSPNKNPNPNRWVPFSTLTAAAAELRQRGRHHNVELQATDPESDVELLDGLDSLKGLLGVSSLFEDPASVDEILEVKLQLKGVWIWSYAPLPSPPLSNTKDRRFLVDDIEELLRQRRMEKNLAAFEFSGMPKATLCWALKKVLQSKGLGDFKVQEFIDDVLAGEECLTLGGDREKYEGRDENLSEMAPLMDLVERFVKLQNCSGVVVQMGDFCLRAKRRLPLRDVKNYMGEAIKLRVASGSPKWYKFEMALDELSVSNVKDVRVHMISEISSGSVALEFILVKFSSDTSMKHILSRIVSSTNLEAANCGSDNIGSLVIDHLKATGRLRLLEKGLRRMAISVQQEGTEIKTSDDISEIGSERSMTTALHNLWTRLVDESNIELGSLPSIEEELLNCRASFFILQILGTCRVIIDGQMPSGALSDKLNLPHDGQSVLEAARKDLGTTSDEKFCRIAKILRLDVVFSREGTDSVSVEVGTISLTKISIPAIKATNIIIQNVLCGLDLDSTFFGREFIVRDSEIPKEKKEEYDGVVNSAASNNITEPLIAQWLLDMNLKASCNMFAFSFATDCRAEAAELIVMKFGACKFETSFKIEIGSISLKAFPAILEWAPVQVLPEGQMTFRSVREALRESSQTSDSVSPSLEILGHDVLSASVSAKTVKSKRLKSRNYPTVNFGNRLAPGAIVDFTRMTIPDDESENAAAKLLSGEASFDKEGLQIKEGFLSVNRLVLRIEFIVMAAVQYIGMELMKIFPDFEIEKEQQVEVASTSDVEIVRILERVTGRIYVRGVCLQIIDHEWTCNFLQAAFGNSDDLGNGEFQVLLTPRIIFQIDFDQLELECGTESKLELCVGGVWALDGFAYDIVRPLSYQIDDVDMSRMSEGTSNDSDLDFDVSRTNVFSGSQRSRSLRSIRIPVEEEISGQSLIKVCYSQGEDEKISIGVVLQSLEVHLRWEPLMSTISKLRVPLSMISGESPDHDVTVANKVSKPSKDPEITLNLDLNLPVFKIVDPIVEEKLPPTLRPVQNMRTHLLCCLGHLTGEITFSPGVSVLDLELRNTIIGTLQVPSFKLGRMLHPVLKFRTPLKIILHERTVTCVIDGLDLEFVPASVQIVQRNIAATTRRTWKQDGIEIEEGVRSVLDFEFATCKLRRGNIREGGGKFTRFQLNVIDHDSNPQRIFSSVLERNRQLVLFITLVHIKRSLIFGSVEDSLVVDSDDEEDFFDEVVSNSFEIELKHLGRRLKCFGDALLKEKREIRTRSSHGGSRETLPDSFSESELIHLCRGEFMPNDFRNELLEGATQGTTFGSTFGLPNMTWASIGADDQLGSVAQLSIQFEIGTLTLAARSGNLRESEKVIQGELQDFKLFLNVDDGYNLCQGEMSIGDVSLNAGIGTLQPALFFSHGFSKALRIRFISTQTLKSKHFVQNLIEAKMGKKLGLVLRSTALLQLWRIYRDHGSAEQITAWPPPDILKNYFVYSDRVSNPVLARREARCFISSVQEELGGARIELDSFLNAFYEPSMEEGPIRDLPSLMYVRGLALGAALNDRSSAAELQSLLFGERLTKICRSVRIWSEVRTEGFELSLTFDGEELFGKTGAADFSADISFDFFGKRESLQLATFKRRSGRIEVSQALRSFAKISSTLGGRDLLNMEGKLLLTSSQPLLRPFERLAFVPPSKESVSDSGCSSSSCSLFSSELPHELRDMLQTGDDLEELYEKEITNLIEGQVLNLKGAAHENAVGRMIRAALGRTVQCSFVSKQEIKIAPHVKDLVVIMAAIQSWIAAIHPIQKTMDDVVIYPCALNEARGLIDHKSGLKSLFYRPVLAKIQIRLASILISTGYEDLDLTCCLSPTNLEMIYKPGVSEKTERFRMGVANFHSNIMFGRSSRVEICGCVTHCSFLDHRNETNAFVSTVKIKQECQTWIFPLEDVRRFHDMLLRLERLLKDEALRHGRSRILSLSYERFPDTLDEVEEIVARMQNSCGQDLIVGNATLLQNGESLGLLSRDDISISVQGLEIVISFSKNDLPRVLYHAETRFIIYVRQMGQEIVANVRSHIVVISRIPGIQLGRTAYGLVSQVAEKIVRSAFLKRSVDGIADVDIKNAINSKGERIIMSILWDTCHILPSHTLVGTAVILAKDASFMNCIGGGCKASLVNCVRLYRTDEIRPGSGNSKAEGMTTLAADSVLVAPLAVENSLPCEISIALSLNNDGTELRNVVDIGSGNVEYFCGSDIEDKMSFAILIREGEDDVTLRSSALPLWPGMSRLTEMISELSSSSSSGRCDRHLEIRFLQRIPLGEGNCSRKASFLKLVTTISGHQQMSQNLPNFVAALVRVQVTSDLVVKLTDGVRLLTKFTSPYTNETNEQSSVPLAVIKNENGDKFSLGSNDSLPNQETFIFEKENLAPLPVLGDCHFIDNLGVIVETGLIPTFRQPDVTWTQTFAATLLSTKSPRFVVATVCGLAKIPTREGFDAVFVLEFPFCADEVEAKRVPVGELPRCLTSSPGRCLTTPVADFLCSSIICPVDPAAQPFLASFVTEPLPLERELPNAGPVSGLRLVFPTESVDDLPLLSRCEQKLDRFRNSSDTILGNCVDIKISPNLSIKNETDLDFKFLFRSLTDQICNSDDGQVCFIESKGATKIRLVQTETSDQCDGCILVASFDGSDILMKEPREGLATFCRELLTKGVEPFIQIDFLAQEKIPIELCKKCVQVVTPFEVMRKLFGFFVPSILSLLTSGLGTKGMEVVGKSPLVNFYSRAVKIISRGEFSTSTSFLYDGDEFTMQMVGNELEFSRGSALILSFDQMEGRPVIWTDPHCTKTSRGTTSVSQLRGKGLLAFLTSLMVTTREGVTCDLTLNKSCLPVWGKAARRRNTDREFDSGMVGLSSGDIQSWADLGTGSVQNGQIIIKGPPSVIETIHLSLFSVRVISSGSALCLIFGLGRSRFHLLKPRHIEMLAELSADGSWPPSACAWKSYSLKRGRQADVPSVALTVTCEIATGFSLQVTSGNSIMEGRLKSGLHVALMTSGRSRVYHTSRNYKEEFHFLALASSVSKELAPLSLVEITSPHVEAQLRSGENVALKLILEQVRLVSAAGGNHVLLSWSDVTFEIDVSLVLNSLGSNNWSSIMLSREPEADPDSDSDSAAATKFGSVTLIPKGQVRVFIRSESHSSEAFGLLGILLSRLMWLKLDSLIWETRDKFGSIDQLKSLPNAELPESDFGNLNGARGWRRLRKGERGGKGLRLESPLGRSRLGWAVGRVSLLDDLAKVAAASGRQELLAARVGKFDKALRSSFEPHKGLIFEVPHLLGPLASLSSIAKKSDDLESELLEMLDEWESLNLCTLGSEEAWKSWNDEMATAARRAFVNWRDPWSAFSFLAKLFDGFCCVRPS